MFFIIWLLDNGIGICTQTFCHPPIIWSKDGEKFSEIILQPRFGRIYWSRYKDGKSTRMVAGMDGARVLIYFIIYQLQSF